MALVQVSPANVDYGEYARPTKVEYSGAGTIALGKAIAQGITDIGKFAGEQIDKRRKWNEETYQTTAALNEEAALANDVQQKQFITDLIEQYSLSRNPRTARQMKRKDPQGYYLSDKIMNDNIKAILSIDSFKSLEENMKKIDPSSVKDQDLERFELARKLSNKEFTYQLGDNGMVYINTGDETPMLLKDVIENVEDYTDFAAKFTFDDVGVQDEMKSIGAEFDRVMAPLFKNMEMNGLQLLNYNEAKEQIKRLPAFNAFIGRNAKDIMSDVVLNGEKFPNAEAMIDYAANQAIMYSKQFGDKIPIPKPVSTGSSSGGGLNVNSEAENLFNRVRSDFSTFATSAVGRATVYDPKTGILRSTDSKANPVVMNLTVNKGFRRSLYEKIFDVVLSKDYSGKEKTAMRKKFLDLVDENPAYISADIMDQAQEQDNKNQQRTESGLIIINNNQ